MPVTEASRVPLKETEIGPVSEHWELVRLDSVVDMKYGFRTSIPKTVPRAGVPIISTAEILSDGILDLSKIRTVDMPNHLVERYTVRSGDILFNWRNAQEHVGKAALVEEQPRLPTVYASFVIRIRTSEGVQNRFLHYLLTFMRVRRIFFKLSRRAVNQANFNANELGELQIALPPVEEQFSISTILDKVCRKIDAEEKRKAALQALFKSMLHHLMTGKIRVPWEGSTK